MEPSYTQRTYYSDNKIRKETTRTADFVVDTYYSPLGHKEKRVKVFDKKTSFQELFFQEGPIKQQIYYSEGFGTISVEFELCKVEGIFCSRKVIHKRSSDNSSNVVTREYQYWNDTSLTKKQIKKTSINTRDSSKNKILIKSYDLNGNVVHMPIKIVKKVKIIKKQ